MYVPTWLIIIIVILGIYYFVKLKKRNSNNTLPEIVKQKSFKQKFSYKLDIHIQPNWYNLYKKINGLKSEKDFECILEEKYKEIKKDDSSGLWGRQYNFTEYYDSVSGLTTMFQRVFCQNGKQYFYPVDKFGDTGYVFESDNEFGPKQNPEKGKLSIEIGEDFIYNDIFEKNFCGIKSIYEKENCLFQFPLSDVFNFLFALGQRFEGMESNYIVKWPDCIEKKFKENGIKYEPYFEPDYEWKPEVFDLEKQDKNFFEKMERPQIAILSDEKGSLMSDIASYEINLKIFRPGENDRISELPPRIN